MWLCNFIFSKGSEIKFGQHGNYGNVRASRPDGVQQRTSVPRLVGFRRLPAASGGCEPGKGVGGKLMRAALEAIDQGHMPAYLENSKAKNIPFYRSFGFEIMKEVVPGKDCPPMWLMWRAPR